ncbi:MAG: hypothetical protein V3T99_00050 [Nitrososphaerales archaeon]
MAGDAFIAGENMVGTGKVQKMNQKTRFRGTGAEVSAMSGDDGPHPGQEVFISSTGSGFTVDKIYRRNNADSAWQEMADVSTGRAFDANLLLGLGGERWGGFNQVKYPGLQYSMVSSIITEDVVANGHKEWVGAIAATGTIIMQGGDGGKLRMATGTTSGAEAKIDFGDVDNFRMSMNPRFEVVLTQSSITALELRFGFTDGTMNGWIGDSIHFADMEIDTVINGDASIFIESRDGSTRTRTDTGEAMTAGQRNTYRLELNNTTNIELFRDDVSIGTKTTNLPGNTTPMQPFVWLETTDTGTKVLDLLEIRLYWDDENND